jgi:hypothetical protein
MTAKMLKKRRNFAQQRVAAEAVPAKSEAACRFHLELV